MKGQWKKIGKVFAFTWSQKCGSSRWRIATILVAVLLLLLPAGIMGLVELVFGSSQTPTENPVTQVFVADETDTAPMDWNQLNGLGAEGYTQIQYTLCDTPEQARSQGEQVSHSAVLLVEPGENGLSLTLLRPDKADYDLEELSGLEQFLSQSASFILMEKAGLDAAQLQSFSAQVETTRQVQGESGEALTPQQQQIELVRMVFSVALPFVLMMALYFMVLFYGQGVANNVLMEKNAKLMDTLLLAVKPTTLVFGKVFALVCASLFQLCLWVAALVGGFGLGYIWVQAMNPATQNPLVLFLDHLGQMDGLFSPAGWILALLLLAAGFLLYCSLAAIGGAAAGKPEDLSSTNLLFTLALVVSFFCVLYGGGMGLVDSGADPAGDWMNWIPFTAILVTPSRLLLGQIPLWMGACSLALTVLCALALLWVSGKVYRMMALYKGNPPSVGKMFRMLRREK